ncbi:MAG TPA: hypothetical protein VIV60_00775, partial [Polyangiaceae bacterium]
MKPFIPCFALVMLCMRPALGVESVTLAPSALKAVAIAGDTSAPTTTAQNVGTSYQIRARDFGTGPVRDNIVYLRFDLSPLKNTILQTASITFNKVAGDTLVTGRFALFGLPDMPGNLAQNWTASSFAYGAEFDPSLAGDAIASSGICPINLSNVVDMSTQETVSGNAATLSSAGFVSFLQARADVGGSATLILSMPTQGNGNDKSITYAFPGYTDPTLAMALKIAYAPYPLPDPPTTFELDGINYSATPSLTVGWNAIDGAIEYHVYRRAASETTPTLVATTKAPTYFDPNVDLFGTYFYSVDVVTAHGQSAASPEFQVPVIDLTLGVPAPPNGLRTTATLPNTISLAWEPVAGALFYQLFRSTEEDGTFTQVQV